MWCCTDVVVLHYSKVSLTGRGTKARTVPLNENLSLLQNKYVKLDHFTEQIMNKCIFWFICIIGLPLSDFGCQNLIMFL